MISTGGNESEQLVYIPRDVCLDHMGTGLLHGNGNGNYGARSQQTLRNPGLAQR